VLLKVCVCVPGLLCLLPGEVQALEVQQGVRVPGLGHRPRLVFGHVLHDLHPHGDGHQDLTVRWIPDRGELVKDDVALASRYPKSKARCREFSRP